MFFINHLLIGLVAIFFISQYINNLFENINITIITTAAVSVLSLIYILFSLNKLKKVKKDFVLIFSAILFLSITYFLYSYGYKGLDKFYKVIPFILTLPLAHYIVQTNSEELLSKYIVLVSIVGLGLILSDIELVIKSVMSATRGLYDVSPLNISSLGLITSLICLQIYFKNKSYIYLVLSLVMFVLSFIGGSKGPLVGFFVSIILYFFISSRNKIFFLFKSLIFIGALYAFLMILVSNEVKLAERFVGVDGTNNETSVSERQASYSWTYSKIINEHIIFGSGVDTFKNEYSYGSYPHNILLELAYEIGLISTLFIMFVFIFILIFNKLYKVDYIYFPLFVYLFIEAQLSHDLSFLRNIVFIYFILYFIEKKKRSSIN